MANVLNGFKGTEKENMYIDKLETDNFQFLYLFIYSFFSFSFSLVFFRIETK